MEANHTPGPWRVKSQATENGQLETRIGNDIRVRQQLFGTDIPTCAANARLMAAAPELLVELRQLAETAHNHFTVPDSVWAAISKATGGAA